MCVWKYLRIIKVWDLLYWGSFDFLISFTVIENIIPQHDRTCSSKITTFGYYGCATFLTYTFLTWLLIAHNEGMDTWSILSHDDVGALGAISSEITTFCYYGCATFMTCTFLTRLLIAHNEGNDTWSILSHGDVGAMGQLSILFMDMIVTFLWHIIPLKSVNLWIILMF